MFLNGSLGPQYIGRCFLFIVESHFSVSMIPQKTSLDYQLISDLYLLEKIM